MEAVMRTTEVEPRRGGIDDERDDLDHFLEEELRDPEFRAAYEDAAARSALLRALVNRRGERGISQSEVAARMGTTQSAVSDLERGATDPRLSTLQRYARALGYQLSVQLHGSGGALA
jgi:ribosome-binding protein aMBF1 (putative translation factor)